MAGPLLRSLSPRVLALAGALLVGSGPAAAVEPPAESLLDVYRQAVEADPRLRGQGLEAEVLRAEQREALAGLLPQAVARAEIRRIDREEIRTGSQLPPEARDYTQEQYGVDLYQPVFDLAAWHSWQASDRRTEAGEAELEAERQELVYRVTEAYLEVLAAQAELELIRREREAVAARLEQTEARHAEDLVARSELEEVRARRANVSASVRRAESELDTARERLAEIIDERPERLAGLADDPQLPEPQPAALEPWLERALADNPRIVAARSRVEAGGREVRAARGERYPRVDLTAGYMRFDDYDGSRQSRELEDYSIGLQVNVPLYEGGAASARVQRAERERGRELEELEQTRRGVRSEARSAFNGLESLRAELSALEQSVRAGERAVEAAEAEVDARVRSVVDLLDAEHELFAARRDRTEAQHEYLLRTVELRRAAGQLDIDDVRALDRLFKGVP